MNQHCAILIIGAGPAGMAAAVELSQAGKDVTVVDQAASPGGQIYRQLAQPRLPESILGSDYFHGAKLVDAFLQAPIRYQPNSRVFWLESHNEGYRIGAQCDGVAHTLTTDHLILATGAMERPVPFPGWTLPGVMTAGAVQIVMKQSGLVPDSPAVLAGTGPLLLMLAHQLVQAGQPPALVLDCTPKSAYLKPAYHLNAAWQGRKYLMKGLQLLASLKKAMVPVLQGVDNLHAMGDGAVSAVRYRHKQKNHEQPCSLLLTHFGVVPEPQAARALGVEYGWHASQQAFVPARNNRDFHVAPGLWMIGDCAGIQGAINAELEGRLLAKQFLEASDASLRGLRRQRAQEQAVRPLLESMFRVPENFEHLDDDTIVCRCESVTKAQLDHAVADGAQSPNQLKTFTRCGMGPCQGRMCGQTVSQQLAQTTQQPLDAVGYFRIRTPINPVTLDALGNLHKPTIRGKNP